MTHSVFWCATAPHCILGDVLSSTISVRTANGELLVLSRRCPHGGETPNYLKIGVNLEHYKQNKKQLSILWSMYIFSNFWGNKSAVAVSEQSQALSVLKICKSWGSVKRECSAGMEQTSGGRHSSLGTSGCAPEGKQTKSRIRCVPLCGHAPENAKTCRFCSETVLNVTKPVGARNSPVQR